MTYGQLMADEVNLLIAERVEPAVIFGGTQGPPGASNQKFYMNRVAGEMIPAHRVVVSGVGGMCYLPDLNNPDHSIRVLGVSTKSSLLGEGQVIQASADLTEYSWNWEEGKEVFIGIGGVLTQTPEVGVSFLMSVGFALSTNTLLIRLGDPVILSP